MSIRASRVAPPALSTQTSSMTRMWPCGGISKMFSHQHRVRLGISDCSSRSCEPTSTSQFRYTGSLCPLAPSLCLFFSPSGFYIRSCSLPTMGRQCFPWPLSTCVPSHVLRRGPGALSFTFSRVLAITLPPLPILLVYMSTSREVNSKVIINVEVSKEL
jgi:hypothetical protein